MFYVRAQADGLRPAAHDIMCMLLTQLTVLPLYKL